MNISDENQTEIFVKHEDVIEKINHYLELFKKLRLDVLDAKEKANTMYSRLTMINNTFQSCIIGISASTTLMQSTKDIKEFTDNDKYFMSILPAISGLIIAMSRLFRIEDKKELTHNIRDRLFDLQGRIDHNIDYIIPWKNEEHYSENFNGTKGKDKTVEWTSLIERVDAEYLSIIDTKRELFSNIEKIFDVLSKQYNRKYNKTPIKDSSTQTDKGEVNV